ncbi:MAG: ubiquinol-cytochrome c reductase iron-sulfur subunit [Egibacteraceae bacterium]
MLLSWLGATASLGGASLAFLWPKLRGGFGATFDVGSEAEVLANIKATANRWEFPSGRTLFVRYDPSLDPDGQYMEVTGGTQVMALYWKCVHLGCKVPWCASSQWWECPCHGSRYNRWGEYQAGPAPRGLDRFRIRTEQGRLVLDTSAVVTGPPRGGGVVDQPPAGPFCV